MSQPALPRSPRALRSKGRHRAIAPVGPIRLRPGQIILYLQSDASLRKFYGLFIKSLRLSVSNQLARRAWASLLFRLANMFLAAVGFLIRPRNRALDRTPRSR
jgi:hypothetical protein